MTKHLRDRKHLRGRKPPENATVIGSSVLTQEIDRLSDGIIAAIKNRLRSEIPADIYGSA